MLIRQNEDGVWDEYKPFTEIVIETEDDFNKLQEAVKLWHDVKSGKAIVTYKEDAQNEKAVH